MPGDREILPLEHLQSIVERDAVEGWCFLIAFVRPLALQFARNRGVRRPEDFANFVASELFLRRRNAAARNDRGDPAGYSLTKIEERVRDQPDSKYDAGAQTETLRNAMLGAIRRILLPDFLRRNPFPRGPLGPDPDPIPVPPVDFVSRERKEIVFAIISQWTDAERVLFGVRCPSLVELEDRDYAWISSNNDGLLAPAEIEELLSVCGRDGQGRPPWKVVSMLFDLSEGTLTTRFNRLLKKLIKALEGHE